jgi:lipoprotein signal peptidase
MPMASSSVAAQDSASAAPAATRSALYDLASHLRVWPIAVIGLTLDLWSKNLAFRTLDGGRPDEIIPRVLSFQRQVNTGALFGMGSGLAVVFVGASVLALLFVLYLFIHSTPRRRSLHVALGLILAGALGNLYDRTFHLADAVWGPKPAGTFSLSGRNQVYASGKLVAENEASWMLGMYPDGSEPVQRIPKAPDRYLKYTPVVRDFIKIELQAGNVRLWPWVFNIADSLLVVGVGLLVINLWREQRKPAAARAGSSAGRPSDKSRASDDTPR